MKIFNKSIYYFLAAILLISCTENNPEPISSANQVLVFNEGNFNSGNATIGLYDIESEMHNPSAYNNANQNEFVGDVLQHAKADISSVYTILNGSNSIKKLDKNSLEQIDEINDDRVDKPRYMAIDDNTAYVTNWGPYDSDSTFNLVNSSVLKINLDNFSIENVIDAGTYVEQIIVDDAYIYVARKDFSGSIKEVQLINKSTESIEGSIGMPSAPAEFFEDNAGNIWVSCTGGQLVQLEASNQSIVQTVNLGTSIINDIDVYDNAVFALATDGSVIRFNFTDGSTETVFTVEASSTYKAFGIDTQREEYYIADFIDYGKEGEIVRIASDGSIIDSFVTGIGPTQFIFN